MNDREQKKKAKEFADFWKNKGYEKGQSQQFWTHLISSVYGIDEPEKFLEFEDQVMLDNSTGFIDVYIPSTKVLIEQKSIEKDLRKPINQSNGSPLTPFQQAQRYISNLPLSKHPKWVITCNFKSFLIYNMENPNSEPEEILLENLETEYYRLQFIVDIENENIKREMEISIKAGEVVGKLYDELLSLYIDPNSERALKSLNMLCVRLVFCLYAEDAGLFAKHAMFHDYLNRFEARDLRRALIDLFKVLDTKPQDRDPYLEEKLLEFPYVNGGLFANEDIEIPMLNDTVKQLLLQEASEDFNWSEISPTIFGAVFESTLNPVTRRNGGMHYTSIENIHKVIDPLFLDELKTEFTEINMLKNMKIRKNRLMELQNKISQLKFLDPACGSGNFLTESYLSLRRLENKILERYQGNGQIAFGDEKINPIKVSISQFYGIEINDFAVTVAKTALWIAESQMMKETETILNLTLDFLPLKSYVNVIEENALTIDWNDVVPSEELNYIMGNPPFVGARLMDEQQKHDLQYVFSLINCSNNIGNADYVLGWYVKASKYMENSKIECAFVSTNSICQGEQVEILWEPLFNLGISINFAYRTFKWNSEANERAQVHCIIVGFGYIPRPIKKIFHDEKENNVKNINGYLVEASNIIIKSRTNPLYDVPNIEFGSMANDKGFLSNYDKEKKEAICSRYPKAIPLFKKILGADEYINNKERYCLWLKDVPPDAYKDIPPIMEAIRNVKQNREQSNREATQRLAEYPYLFGEIRQPNSDYIIVPRVSSENRRYIPIGFISKDVIASDAVQIIPNGNLYNFGILTSNVHMAWMRAVAGRLKSDYRYSAKIVYNNFPWCTPTKQQKERIEETAQAILEARAFYTNSTLADLYDELIMPVKLREAHRANDRAVMEAYGFVYDERRNGSKYYSESETVAKLMEMYQNKLNENCR